MAFWEYRLLVMTWDCPVHESLGLDLQSQVEKFANKSETWISRFVYQFKTLHHAHECIHFWNQVKFEFDDFKCRL